MGHVSPEAQVGGPIAVVRTGDMVTIDVARRVVDMAVPAEEIAARLSQWSAPPSKGPARGMLARYARTVGSASEGACLE